MHRTERLPTRVSKACDRCKKQKQRCDFERPCRHCEHARTSCTTSSPPTTTKSRIRRNNKGQAANYVDRPEEHETSTRSSTAQEPSARDEPGEYGQGRMAWSPPKPSDVSDGQISGPARSQSHRESSSLPGFDADSALAITRKIFRSQESQAYRERATFAIPGGGHHRPAGTNSASNMPSPLVAVQDIIGIELPKYEVCNKLLERYFSAVHWFSLVVYEPKFRRRYSTIVGSGLSSRNDRGFLLLLLIILVMGCWYSSKNITGDEGLSRDELDALRSKLLSVVQREFMDLMDEDSLEFVQLCTLLGSFYLYHGRPRSSFSILGAATKTSQAMNLHRESDSRWSVEDREERKRVWWTLYTWDRFATITYGRPLGINEKDCNVSMPLELTEDVNFNPQSLPIEVCLSTYQCRLNQIYKIASPLLEDIYGIRASYDRELYSQLPEMVATANRALLEWQQDLPPHLSLDHLNDLTPYSSAEDKAHGLQALSLQLTYDNLMIVLHRPLLASQMSAGQSAALGADQITSPGSQFSDDLREVGFKRCLKSALRISHIQRKGDLFALARTTHLVSFLGMNLFTASVVLFLCALSDTLSDTAQEAKRGLRRTLQMQKALSKHASLSMQCSTILEDLVQLILKKEMEEMLYDNTASGADSLPDYGASDQGHDGAQAQVRRSSFFRAPNVGFDSTNQEVSQPEGSHFNQSLRTLQRVFHDSNMIRQYGAIESGPTSRNEHENLPTPNNASQAGFTAPLDFGYSDGTFTGVEDLGQFWLWDLDNLNF